MPVASITTGPTSIAMRLARASASIAASQLQSAVGAAVQVSLLNSAQARQISTFTCTVLGCLLLFCLAAHAHRCRVTLGTLQDKRRFGQSPSRNSSASCRCRISVPHCPMPMISAGSKLLIPQPRAARLSRSAFTTAVAAGSAWSGLRAGSHAEVIPLRSGRR